MALPPASEVALYRAAMRDVNTLAQRDLLLYWRTYNFGDAVAVQAALTAALPGIINTYHLAAATVAADFYDLMRSDAGIRRQFSAIIADQPTIGRAEALAGWGTGPLFSANPSPDVALTKVSGGLQRTILNGARDTIVKSASADPAKTRWLRVTSGNACQFCTMLAARGAVYRSEGTADFLSHDHCHCDAVPDFP